MHITRHFDVVVVARLSLLSVLSVLTQVYIQMQLWIPEAQPHLPLLCRLFPSKTSQDCRPGPDQDLPFWIAPARHPLLRRLHGLRDGRPRLPQAVSGHPVAAAHPKALPLPAGDKGDAPVQRLLRRQQREH